MLAYLTRKDKPVSYIETHAGRGLCDLDGAEARKTGEDAQGIERVEARLPVDHPYRRVPDAVRRDHGRGAYPSSPLIASRLLRPGYRIDLAERHPQEYTALVVALSGTNARVQAEDGFEMAHRLIPPDPRRGVLLVDPSYEVKDDYANHQGRR